MGESSSNHHTVATLYFPAQCALGAQVKNCLQTPRDLKLMTADANRKYPKSPVVTRLHLIVKQLPHYRYRPIITQL